MKDYYASRAPWYDEVYAKPERARDLAWLRAELPLRLKDRDVLEIACGTGYWTAVLANAVRSLLATDGTPEPLDIARKRPGTERVIYRLADAFHLPADLGQYDGAFAGLWFSHVPVARRTEFLSGLHGRLKPGARVLFIDNSEVQCRDFPIVSTDAEGNTWQDRPLRDGTTHRLLKNFPSRRELLRMIEGIGVCPEFKQLENFWLFQYETVGL